MQGKEKQVPAALIYFQRNPERCSASHRSALIMQQYYDIQTQGTAQLIPDGKKILQLRLRLFQAKSIPMDDRRWIHKKQECPVK